MSSREKPPDFPRAAPQFDKHVTGGQLRDFENARRYLAGDVIAESRSPIEITGLMIEIVLSCLAIPFRLAILIGHRHRRENA
mgnify:CR=1 FL=1